MFSLHQFTQTLDALYQSGKMQQAGQYLEQMLQETVSHQNKEGALCVLNEYMGYDRVKSLHQQCRQHRQQALTIIKELGLTGTLEHATTLMNAATGLRAMGMNELAEEDYLQAKQILEGQPNKSDGRLAALYNNLSLLYLQTNCAEQAQTYAEQALEILKQLPNSQQEQAITHANLANIYLCRDQLHKAKRSTEQAIEWFRQTAPTDPHYPAALAGLAEINVREGDLQAAKNNYEQALRQIEQIYGKNDDWKIVHKNLEKVNSLLERMQQFQSRGEKGMQLARRYYETVGKPMLHAKYAEYCGRMAVGLMGEGSECLGFDDEFSTDHDFGAGFCIWLTREDYEKIGESLQRDYDALTKSWDGFPVKLNQTEKRVGVFCIDEYYRRLTGMEKPMPIHTLSDVLEWAKTPTSMLRAAVSGEVFSDPLGEFSSRRDGFANEPEPVRLYRLAKALAQMAQAGQYNYPRASKRGDIAMMYHCLSQFIQAASAAGYLLNRRHMPSYKWVARGMDEFTVLSQLKGDLERLMKTMPNDPAAVVCIEKVCGDILQELRKQNLTTATDGFLEVHKAEVLKRMQQLLEQPQKEQPQPDKLKKEALIARIIDTEWNQFQNVQNEGGRASCQNDRKTFQIMRESQFITWNEQVLESYYDDLIQAQEKGWNLLTEKYARMMKYTSPQEYQKLQAALPQRGEMRLLMQGILVCMMLRWNESMQQQYPALMKMGRSAHASQDTQWNTSSETYLQGELGSYSDRTLCLYAQMVLDWMEQQKNPVKESVLYTVQCYGYSSLEQADRAYT